MKAFTAVVIQPHHSGFGMYQPGEAMVSPENSFPSVSDLVDNALEQGAEFVPIDLALEDNDFIEAGIEDIRGRVYNEPSLLYVELDSDNSGKFVRYFGVVESEVEHGFFD